MRLRLALVTASLCVLALSPVAGATTYTVNNVGDAPDAVPGNDACATAGAVCTLRAAIQEANAHANGAFPDRIEFNIGAGPQLIGVPSGLDTLSERVVIDATTQPGPGAIPLVRLAGNGPAAHDGIEIGSTAGASEIKGLSLTEFQNAIELDGSTTVTQSFIGLRTDGTAAAGTNATGVYIGAGAAGSTIGDNTDPALRNVISNNVTGVIDVEGAGAQIYGNYIGTNPAGTAAIPNTDGVLSGLAALGGAVIIGNTISGNTDDGIDADGAGFIDFNKIGTNAAGTAAVPNGDAGVEVSEDINDFHSNTISGNLGGGIVIEAGSSSNIRKNFIGTTSDGTGSIPNLGSGGIAISNAAGGNFIGGLVAGDGNVIANNSPWGVRVTAGAGNRFLRNSIHSNSGLGIDLGNAGVLANDASDPDGDPNSGQNFPVLSSAIAFNAISGTLNSAPGKTYTLQFFASQSCDPSGHGEGATFLAQANVNTDATGNASFAVPLPLFVAVGRQITATATNDQDNTSEFSRCVGVTTRRPPSTEPRRRDPDSDIIRPRRREKQRRFQRYAGLASDPDNDLARVEIAVVRVTGGARAAARKPRRCLRLRRNGKLKRGKPNRRGRCRITGFIKVKGTTRWSLKLKRRLPKGKYVVYSRAIDKAGNRERTFTARDKNRRAFTLR